MNQSQGRAVAPATAGMPTHLPLPAQAKPNSRGPRKRDVDDWLRRLPSANLPATGAALLELLTESNRTPMPAGRRISLLDALQGPVEDAVLGLRSCHGGGRLPPEAAEQEASRLSRALTREMALGYDQAAAASRHWRRRRMARALQRAVHHYGRMLFEYHYLYQPAAEGLWQRLHELYLAAEAAGIEQLRVAEGACSPGSRRTVADSYKQLLLFNIAGPHGVRHQELEGVFAELGELAPHVSLRPFEPSSADSADDWVVDLRLDQAPQPAVAAPAGSSPLVRRLDWRDALDRAGASGRCPFRRRDALAPQTRRRIQTLIHRPGERRFPRRSVRQSVHAALGLTAISQLLAQEHGVSLGQEAVAVTTHAPDARLHYDAHEHTWRVTQTEQTPAVAAVDMPDAAQVCETLNTSAGGYRLALGRDTALARVGELIALRDPSNRFRRGWQIGIVRWLRQPPDAELELGVELLGVDTLPVAVKPIVAGEQEVHVAEALLLPEMPALRQPARLLTPTLPYVTGMRTLVLGSTLERQVLLGRQHQATGTFRSFEFAPIAEEAGGLKPPAVATRQP